MPHHLLSLVDTVQANVEGFAMTVAASPLIPWITSRKAALGLIFSILTVAFAAGGAVTLFGSTILNLPDRVTALEIRQDATDALADERWTFVQRLLCQVAEESTGRIPPECDLRVYR